MPNSQADEQRVIAVYRQMHRSMVEADTSGLASILTHDFRLVHMTGYDQPRAEWLSQIDSGRMRYFSSVEDHILVTISGDVASVTGRNRVKADIWGAQGTWPLQLDIDLVRHDDQWLMAHARASTY